MPVYSRIFVIIFFLIAPGILRADTTANREEIMPSHEIRVSFNLENGSLSGVSKITIPKGCEASLDLSGLKASYIAINGRPLIIDQDMTELTCQPSSAIDTVEIRYEAVFRPTTAASREDNPGVAGGNMIGPDGIILMDNWYPAIKGPAVYHLTAKLPGEFEGISEADEVVVAGMPDGSREFSFLFAHPVRGINLIAGRYAVEKDSYNGIGIYTYFLPEDAGLAKPYIDNTKKYLEMYEKLLTAYPFKRFSVVENILPTGYSMPTFTLLGRDVVRLPFIVNTSLGHEILHQWFGNLVYVDYRGGNWSEGLTTYLSDNLYEEKKGSGWDYRKQQLISFQSYVSAEKDMPLTSFSGRSDPATRSIGYGKAAMVFHMLRDLAGEDAFYAGLRTLIKNNMFKEASWSDIRAAIEASSDRKFDWFFKQWLEEKGVPEIAIENLNLTYRGSRAVVSFDIVRKGGQYRLSVPITVRTKDGGTVKRFELEKESTAAEIETSGSPVELIVDENYDVFRKLSGAEFPPVISRLLGDPKKIFVLPADKETEYASLSSFLKELGFSEKKEAEVTFDDIRSTSFVMINTGSALTGRLFGSIEKQKDDFSVSVRENPYNNNAVIAVVDGSSPPEITKLARKITHYGKYGFISFADGRNSLKTIRESDRGIRKKITEETLGMELRSVSTASDIIGRIADVPVIYIGEFHDRLDNHRMQLEVIRSLHLKNKKIAIGMEMFQRPFQKALDDYIAGTIDEREFLRKSEYFKRWGFDFNLYREILLYAREFAIPVIALNIKKEIVTKVSKEGLYSLTAEELKEIPADMDLSDSEYKTRLREFFGKHKMSSERNFDFFYQSQVLWDESMAHSLYAFMKDRPDYQVVVLAGGGHMAFGSGIPKRAHRLNGKDYSILLNNFDIEKGVADYLLFPDAVRVNEAPKLMTVLKEDKGKVIISDFAADSVAEKAGLKKDDIILSLDNTPVETIDDIKIFLLYKKKGDAVIVKALRNRFLAGDSEMEFKMTL